LEGSVSLEFPVSDPHYWSYREWLAATVNKIATLGASVPDLQDREDYLRVQIEQAIRKAHRHGQSRWGDDDPVTP
jgi:hypothetical protein